jgi:hypothetical protein
MDEEESYELSIIFEQTNLHFSIWLGHAEAKAGAWVGTPLGQVVHKE